WRAFDCPNSSVNQGGGVFTGGYGSINPPLRSDDVCAGGGCPSVDVNGTGSNQAGGVCYFEDLGTCPTFLGGAFVSSGVCYSSVPQNKQCRDFTAQRIYSSSTIDQLPGECWYGVNCGAGAYGLQSNCHADINNTCDGTPGNRCNQRFDGCYVCDVSASSTTTSTLPTPPTLPSLGSHWNCWTQGCGNETTCNGATTLCQTFEEEFDQVNGQACSPVGSFTGTSGGCVVCDPGAGISCGVQCECMAD
ncbi:MAG: hypothetical protein KDD25_05250, partial [Bdellovibrionales bacterium]|nr:hypothetical protein [Bdellovibrionales bacterium]